MVYASASVNDGGECRRKLKCKRKRERNNKCN